MGKMPNPRFLRDEDLTQGIEALFFGYRGFTAGPDRLLADRGLGRAHHRALHFIAREPGLTVGKVLDILDITKQSLSRVLRELMEQNLVEQRQGEQDRRQRHLWLTAEGEALIASLRMVQDAVVRKAFANAGAEAVEGFLSVLEGLMSPEDLAKFSTMRK